MFSLIGAVEKAGSGADTIVQGWLEAKFGTPIIIERSEPNKVELTLPINTMTSNGDGNVASNVASNQRKRKSYGELCILIINLCKTWKTRQEIVEESGYKQDYLRNYVLPRMVADGYLEKLDKNLATNPNQKNMSTKNGMNLLDLTEGGETKNEVRLANEYVWLTT